VELPLLEVGRVVKPHGLAGEVVVELVTNRVERVEPGSVLSSPGGPLSVVRSRPFEATGAGRWIVSFEGVSDREGAEALRGFSLSARPLPSGDDALWVHELIGSSVVDLDGLELGRVTSVEANPASDLLVLEGGGLIPLRFVTASESGRITVDVPPGLLDV
jgi:16S rRNA processing protein RimM